MEESIFTKIINGAIPSYKLFEDTQTLAFLDIHPAQPGHTLVVPKTQTNRLEELTAEDYGALMSTVRLVMQRIVTVFGKEYRACLKVEGFDVPHAHVHIIPCRTAADFWIKQRLDVEPDHQQLAEIAKRLAF